MTRLALFAQVNEHWRLAIDFDAATGGTIPNVPMAAIRADGHTEYFDVSLWPVGWRILRLDLTVPASVRRAAIQIAAEGTGRGRSAA